MSEDLGTKVVRAIDEGRTTFAEICFAIFQTDRVPERKWREVDRELQRLRRRGIVRFDREARRWELDSA